MKQLRVLAASAAFAALAALALPSDAHAGESDPITRIKMSLAELRQFGISLGGGRFPNSCAHAGSPDMSLSNEIVAHFKARGFTLTSLCLGLSSNVRFDPQSRRQLPVAFLPDLPNGHSGHFQPEIPLNLPDCFKRALSFADCGSNYDYFSGTPKRDNAPDIRREQQRDTLYLNFMRQHQISSGVFYSFYGSTHRGREVVFAGRDVTQLFGEGGSEVGRLVASRDLPRSYGYTVICCEGDDPAPEAVSLSTYRKMQDVWALWTDQR